MNRTSLAILSATVALVAATWCIEPTAALAQSDAPDTSGIKIDGEYGPFGLTDVSKDGHRIDYLIDVVHYFMFALFGGWGIFFVYCLVRFRKRAGHGANSESIKAKPAKYSEIAVAVIEAWLLLSFSIPIWASVKNDIPMPTDDDVVRVRVMAEQFAWNFHYPGADGKFGTTAPENVDTATNILGLDRTGDGADDIVSSELHLPINKPVICELSSKDVIHSFFIPVMRVKQDVVPGMRIPVWFEAVKEGTYEIACAQLCGNNHYSMRAILYLESQAQYEAWLEEKSQPPEEFDEDDL
ncbi:MAG: hypothetical protein IIB59_00275 [Planctomycetes bacterium]|nr:hypothetical protein [Planctomycetota bacterium]